MLKARRAVQRKVLNRGRWRQGKLTMPIGDAVIAARVERRCGTLKPLLRLDHRPRRKAIVAAPVLAERDQVGRRFHRTHDGIELDCSGTMPVHEHRKVAVGKRRLVMR
ncbi:MAG: hypothetical protein IPF76_01190 [Sphingopyxis sp.]|nr:hypothetical protein [Sphingopyxis sp.]